MQRQAMSISVNYSFKWQIKGFTNYRFSQCGKLFNVKTGKIKKQCLNGGSVGYWIGRKFYVLDKLRTKLEKIPIDGCPF